MADDKRGELRAKINLALQANGAGGTEFDERKCQCDYVWLSEKDLRMMLRRFDQANAGVDRQKEATQ